MSDTKPQLSLPDLGAIINNVRLGALVDGYLEEIGEFRPGEAWGDCAVRVASCKPILAAWLNRADTRWEEIARSERQS